MPKYKAAKPAFFNGSRVRKGQVIEADFDKVPGHFVPVGAVEPKVERLTHEAVHKGAGKWAVVASNGTEVEGGLEKQRAMLVAHELNNPPEE